MQAMVIGTCIVELHLPAVHSLKEKRSVVKSLAARIHREFNAACGEIGHNDVWQSSALGIAVVSTSAAHAQNALDSIVSWMESSRPDIVVVDHSVEIVYRR
jgi:hypothetical protein